MAGVRPWDAEEDVHLATASEWVRSGAPLYRQRKPDVPNMHLVSYFVLLDEVHHRLLLVAHRSAGLWLPSGGHVEPNEDPWDTVRRECREELHVDAVASTVAGDRPLFVTVTQTTGPGPHTDVSLWFVIRTDTRDGVSSFDEDEIAAIRWLPLREVLIQPITTLDPHMHRFTAKLTVALATSG